ncbi:MAG TPA: P-II family nitrogen regulator [Terriglobia bacterium]|nr:P-II family nitrogen regulator [Terriglobia bacterium]
MKLIQCIVRPDKLDEVVDSLESVIDGITIHEVRGFGRQKGHRLVYRGVEYSVPLLTKVLIEILTDDSWVDDIIKVVTKSARTGEIGDGRIFILPVEQSYNVRTGFMDI